MTEPVSDRLRRTGRDLFLRGLVSGRGGNLSVRVGDVIVITRSGAELGHLGPHDLVEVPVSAPGDRDDEASSDLVVHRAVYERSGARAVVHAHPPSAVVLSFEGRPILPVDHEGKVFVPRIPVVTVVSPRDAVAEHVGAEVAAGARVVLVRTHGTFAAGDAIEAAMAWTTSCEASALVLLGLRQAGINPS